MRTLTPAAVLLTAQNGNADMQKKPTTTGTGISSALPNSPSPFTDVKYATKKAYPSANKPRTEYAIGCLCHVLATMEVLIRITMLVSGAPPMMRDMKQTQDRRAH